VQRLRGGKIKQQNGTLKDIISRMKEWFMN
jgi:cell division protein FtsA